MSSRRSGRATLSMRCRVSASAAHEEPLARTLSTAVFGMAAITGADWFWF
jgi:hypothetical protein